MPFVARATRLLEVPARVAFDHLADHDGWPKWMPASFRPVGKSLGRLAVGQTFHAKILGSPLASKCMLSVVRSPEEITWCGGAKGILWAEHRFLFVPKGERSVEVSSVESWHGPVAFLLRFAIS